MPIDSLSQISPLRSFFGDLQTCTKIVPLPRYFSLNVALFPAGTVSPRCGEIGVMPPAPSAAGASSTVAATTAAAMSRRIGRRNV